MYDRNLTFHPGIAPWVFMCLFSCTTSPKANLSMAQWIPSAILIEAPPTIHIPQRHPFLPLTSFPSYCHFFLKVFFIYCLEYLSSHEPLSSFHLDFLSPYLSKKNSYQVHRGNSTFQIQR